jgi:hypothetical protein
LAANRQAEMIQLDAKTGGPLSGRLFSFLFKTFYAGPSE